jgi:8-oxoguanine deaminase
MLLASGICRVKELEAAGAPVGLGVDGSASNDSSNMMQEVRQAFLLQRIRYGAAAVSHEDALRWGTAGGAQVLHRPDLGTLEPGKAADMAMFDLDELRFSGSGDPVAALVLCGAHKVRHLMVGGEFRVSDGELIGIDVPRLRARHQELANQLAERA